MNKHAAYRGLRGDQLACLLCSKSDFQEIARYTDPDPYEQAVGVTAENYYRAWGKCTNCGFIYSRYSRDPEIIDRLYESSYRDGISNYRRQGTTREIFDRVIALPADQSETYVRISWIKQEISKLDEAGFRLAPHRKQLMLDIGGATGVFAYSFRDENWDAEIVDPAESGRFIEEFGIRYHQRPYGPGVTSRSIDLATMVFVLEHLRNPREVISQARKDLSECGLIYIEVPDASAFHLKPPEDDIFNACHLWMFDPFSLTRLLDECEIEVMTLARTKTRRGHLALSVLASARSDLWSHRSSTK
jgi:hypothetical protein